MHLFFPNTWKKQEQELNKTKAEGEFKGTVTLKLAVFW